MIGDACAIIFSFAFAYFFRTHIDHRPYYFDSGLREFTFTIFLLIPLWWVILSFLGLYNKSIFLAHSKLPEFLRLVAASVIGIMAIITFDFFYQSGLFPVRIIALAAAILCLFSMKIVRGILRFIRLRVVVLRKKGLLNVVIIGNSKNTESLLEYFESFPEDGYRVVGVVANNKYIPAKFRKRKYSSVKDALKKTKADVIFQTDDRESEYVYRQSLKYHLLYFYVPSKSNLLSHFGSLELIGDTPAIMVKTTPLSRSSARFIKRVGDIFFGLLIFIVTLIPCIIVWLIIKLSDPRHSAFYSEYRLSRFNRKVKIYKFRSMKSEYSGLSPEQAFIKMGRPELIKKYRKNGDCLDDDPRITKIGSFIRRTSIDELPQIINVLKGDIALVGPRALVPGELRNYGDRSLLLSIKSGLTGLAQVSGRRDISFEERRALDIYYVQNWSILLDLQIIFRTVGAVLMHRGAK